MNGRILIHGLWDLERAGQRRGRRHGIWGALLCLSVPACGVPTPRLPDASFEDVSADAPSDADAGGSCVGTPMGGCASFGLACRFIVGCVATAECSGAARSCGSMRGASDCRRQAGCSWSSFGDTCSGAPRDCSSLRGRSQCSTQDGCFYDDDCAGEPEGCDLLGTEAVCILVSGCSWEPAGDM